MTDRINLSNGVGLIAWGFIFIFFHFNLGTMDILPEWIGYILISRAITIIGEEEKSALLLQPLAIILIVWELLNWGITTFNIVPTGFIFNTATTIAAIISLYFNFQLFTNLATIAEKYFCPQQSGLLLLRTAYTILITFVSVLPVMPIPTDIMEIISLILIGITIVIIICSSSILFGLKSALKKETL